MYVCVCVFMYAIFMHLIHFPWIPSGYMHTWIYYLVFTLHNAIYYQTHVNEIWHELNHYINVWETKFVWLCKEYFIHNGEFYFSSLPLSMHWKTIFITKDFFKPCAVFISLTLFMFHLNAVHFLTQCTMFYWMLFKLFDALLLQIPLRYTLIRWMKQSSRNSQGIIV